ncbi:MAG: apolipoprotein N-acyltransferase [Endomicrobiaceae bacterium]|nr:apolipoprotein N-acyltransferase [Endomicrobiaceae bacterium]
MIKILTDVLFIRQSKFKCFYFSIISGILIALSFQKFNFFYFAWIGFIPLIYCVLKSNVYYAMIYGFIAGLTCNVISAYWMLPFLFNNTNSLRDSAIVTLLAWLYLTLYFSLWSGVINFTKKYLSAIILAIIASGVWVVFEFIKTYMLTGLPWNLLGYTQTSFLPIIQISEITGVYGISFLIILINMFLYFWLKNKNKKYLFSAIVIIAVLLIYGFFRMYKFDTQYGEKITVGIVQPNIEQYKKWDKNHKNNIIKTLYVNAQFFNGKQVDIILYPETVLPRMLEEDEGVQQLVRAISENAQLNLIGGMSVFNNKIYNTIFLVSQNGEIINKYKKNHPVIFGEYIPFRFMLSKLLTSLNVTGYIDTGKNIQTFKFNEIVLGINICSENLFPYFSRRLVLQGANILTNHTNDAWFLDMATPYQHFGMNIFRAVENRKNVIVSANTGISAVIDSSGRTIKKTKVGENISFISYVYKNNYLTTYDKIGDTFAYICLFYVMSFLCFIALKIHNKK